jgi:hypothetical protein
VIVFEMDSVVLPEPASGQMQLDYYNGEEELTASHTDHIFDTASVLDERVIATPINWIAKHL